MHVLHKICSVSLDEVIIQRIKEEGPITFRDFMEMALYYPTIGYYSSDRIKIGANGDYYTSPNITPLFGQMIAKQIEEMWILMGKGDFTVVEYGGGTGSLCYDILCHLRNTSPLFNCLNYNIIEKSHEIREKGIIFLNEKVTWYNSIHDMGPVTGCILSNEMLDNFAVHIVVMEDELMEIYVDYNNGFKEVLKPASTEIKSYLASLGVILPKGFRTEINLEALEWMQGIALSLKKGFILTIDYGFPSSEYYRSTRRNGTLTCYHRHNVNFDPYSRIGDQDITTHVNFSALSHWGNKFGLLDCGYTDQTHFLLSLGLDEQVRILEHDTHIDDKAKEFLLHSFLMDMGGKLKVLIQQKGLSAPKLSGLKFSFEKLT